MSHQLLHLVQFDGMGFDEDDRHLFDSLPNIQFEGEIRNITVGGGGNTFAYPSRSMGTIIFNSRMKERTFKKILDITTYPKFFKIKIFKDINEWDEDIDISYAMRCVYGSSEPDYTLTDCYAAGFRLSETECLSVEHQYLEVKFTNWK